MKKTNKGFSLVELIIVIAIMAILAGAIAPALIRYIDKSRRSNDVTAAKTIKTAVETALGSENIYEYLTTATTDATILVVPSVKPTTDGTEAGAKYSDAIKINAAGGTTSQFPTGTDANAVTAKEIATNIGETMPKCKYKKNAKDKKAKEIPQAFAVKISKQGSVEVYVVCATSAPTAAPAADKLVEGNACFQLTPTLSQYYQ